MLVNITHDTKAEHARLFGAGVAFITVMALLVGLSIAIYNKSFSHPTMVTIKAQNAGLQLAKFGDVRRHGALVGHVREISNDGKQAVIKVALVPSAAKNIPENVSVEILPTTLFGQKYISIVDPTDPSPKALSNGDVIPSSRVHTNVELQKILADLFPLLRSIRPADLSSTLYALATALRGRGDELGETFVKLDGYLTTMNVHLPTLQQDLVLLARVSKTYSIAAPDLVRLLRNATTTAHTADRQGGAAADLHQRRDRPGQDLDAGADHQRGQHRPGARRCPGRSWACSTPTRPSSRACSRARRATPGRLNEIFRDAKVSQSMTLAATQRRPYDQRDIPAYGEHGHGPKCYGLPYPKVPLEPPGQLQERHRARLDERGQPRMSTDRNTKTIARRGQARHLRPRQRDRHRHADRDHGLLRLRQRDRVQGRLHLRQPDQEGRRRPRRRRHRRLGQGRRDQGPRRRRGHLQDQEGRARHHRDPGLDPLPQPGRRPLHGAGGGHSRTRKRLAGGRHASRSRTRPRR